MQFKLTIDCDNAAFGDGVADNTSELTRILSELLARLLRNKLTPGVTLPMFDRNGKRVGGATFS